MDTVTIVVDEKIGVINPNLYGHFAEHIGGVIYDGIWVGRDSKIPNIDGFRTGIVDAMKRINAPVVRWPGGCFAETYDWRDGIGPASERPVTTNWWYDHDGRLESNQVGTHEFIAFCRAVGAQPYLAANITSTTPLEIRNWIEYCNMPAGSTSLSRERGENGDSEPFDVRYWGIGNENWGGGGNMTPDDYATEYRKYATLASNIPGENRCFIACGPGGNDVDWTLRFFEKMTDRIKDPSRLLQGFSAHYYCGTAGDALNFTQDQWYQLLWQAEQIEPLIVRQRAAMDVFDPDRKIGLIMDEWGCWHPDGSGPSAGGNLFEQQSTMRDALVAALTLNIFANHSDKLVMANIAQLVNNLHSLFLSRDDHLVQTPNYHIFDMFKGHQGGQAVRSVVDTQSLGFEDNGQRRADGRGDSGGERTIGGLSCSASLSSKVLTVTAANLRFDTPTEVRIKILGASFGSGAGAPAGGVATTALLAAEPHAHNTFDAPDQVSLVWSELEVSGDVLDISLPPASVMMLEIPL